MSEKPQQEGSNLDITPKETGVVKAQKEVSLTTSLSQAIAPINETPEVTALSEFKGGQPTINKVTYTPILKEENLIKNINNIYYLGFDDQIELCKSILGSGKFKAFSSKEPHVLLNLINFGKELGLAPLSTLNSVFIIDDKFCIPVDIMKAIVLNNKFISFNIIRNFEPLVQAGATAAYDYVTQIDFTRTFDNGKPPMEYKAIYKWSEAVAARLNTKDNWVKFPKNMMLARAFSEGAKVVAADLLHGVYTKEELE